MRWKTGLAALGFSLAIVAVAHADDDTNPRYTAWSKFKVGSSETLTASISTPQGMAINLEMNRTLKELTDEKVVLEVTTTTEVMGNKRPAQPRQETIMAKKTGDEAYKEVGHETVEAAGKSFDCKVIEAKQPVPSGPGGKTHEGKAKVWINDEIPGGLVKLEGTGMSDQTVTFLLKSYEAK